MKLEVILLSRLFHDAATGFELKKHLDTAGRFTRSNTTMSQVYRTLAQLEERGHVRHTVERRAGATDIKRYGITEEGIAALQDWISSPYNPPSRFQDPDLYFRLSAAGHLTPSEVLAIVNTEIETRLAEVARYRNRERPIAPEHDGYDNAFATAMGEWLHRQSAGEMDRHIAALIDLRTRLLDGRALVDDGPTPTADREKSQ